MAKMDECSCMRMKLVALHAFGIRNVRRTVIANYVHCTANKLRKMKRIKFDEKHTLGMGKIFFIFDLCFFLSFNHLFEKIMVVANYK